MTSKGVRVFYISNRIVETEAESTYNNLKAVGLTLAVIDMLFKVKSSEKTDRRQMVTDQGYRIVMLMMPWATLTVTTAKNHTQSKKHNRTLTVSVFVMII